MVVQEMTPQPLFRVQAVEYQLTNRNWGEIVALRPISIRLLGWLFSIIIIVASTFLSFAEYTRKETVLGRVRPSAGLSRLRSNQPGTVSKIFVKQGDLVQSGQDLITVEALQIDGMGLEANNEITKLYQSRELDIEKQLRLEDDRFLIEQDRITKKIAGLKTEQSYIEAQIASQQRRVEISRDLVQAGSQLSSKGYGYISEVELKRRQQDLMEHEQSLSSFRQQLTSRSSQLAEAISEDRQLVTDRLSKKLTLKGDLAWIKQRIVELQSRRTYTIKSPASGKVAYLNAAIGQTIDNREIQAIIMPPDDSLQAEIFVPTRSAGFVKVGQPVRLTYDAFPSQKFGSFFGQITQLSEVATSVYDEHDPTKFAEASYKAIVELKQSSISAGDRTLSIRPDMSLKAHIMLEKRTLAQWMFAPLERNSDFSTNLNSLSPVFLNFWHYIYSTIGNWYAASSLSGQQHGSTEKSQPNGTY